MACTLINRPVVYRFVDQNGIDRTSAFTKNSLPRIGVFGSSGLWPSPSSHDNLFNDNVPGLFGFEYVCPNFGNSTTIDLNTCLIRDDFFNNSANLDWGSSHSGFGSTKLFNWFFNFGNFINNPEPDKELIGRVFINRFAITFLWRYEDGVGGTNPDISTTINENITISGTGSNSNSVPFFFANNVTYADPAETIVQSAYFLYRIKISVDFHNYNTLTFLKSPDNIGGTLNYPGETIWRENHFTQAALKVGAGKLAHNDITLTANPPSGYSRKKWEIDTVDQLTTDFSIEVDVASITAADVEATVFFEQTIFHNVRFAASPIEAPFVVDFGGVIPTSSPPINQNIEAGTGTTLSAKVNSFGWEISSWSSNTDNPNASGGSLATVSNFISNVTEPITVTVFATKVNLNYSVQNKGITTANDHGTIFVDNVDQGNSGSFTGQVGDSFSLMFTPDVNYRVKSVERGGFGGTPEVLSSGGNDGQSVTVNFTITDANSPGRAITVDWELVEHTVTILAPIGNGSIIPSVGSFTVFGGDVVNLSADADHGWFVSGWSGTNNNSKSGGNNAVVTNISTITADTNIQVTFSQTQFTISGVANGNGTIAPSSRSGVLNDVVEFTGTPTPGSGLSVTGWTGTQNNSKTSPNSEDPVSNTRLITGNGAVHVFFNAVPDVVITTQVASGNGTVSGSGTFFQGSTAVITATPSPGWTVSGWTNTTVNNLTGGDGESVDNNVIADVSKVVTVTFVKVAFTVIGTVSQGSGIICIKKIPLLPCQSSASVSSGSSVTFTATPDPGWLVGSWQGFPSSPSGSVGVPIDNSTGSIIADTNVSVVFVQDFVTVSSSVGLGATNGSVTPSVQQVPRNSVANVQANPNSGWFVSSWTGTKNNNKVGLNGQIVSNTVNAINNTNNIVVNFEQVGVSPTQFNLSVSIAPGQENRGSLATFSGLRTAGTVVNLAATPNTGFLISHWDGADFATFNKITINSNKTAVLYFVEEVTVPVEKRFIDVVVEGNGWVRPISGPYDLNSVVTFTAGAFSGNKFLNWVGVDADPDLTIVGKTGTQLAVTVTSAKTITAIFEEIEGFEEKQQNIFYCPSQGRRNNVISFDHTNEGATGIFNYKLTFYSDVERSVLVSTVQTSNDVRSWFYDNKSFTADFSTFPVAGLSITGSNVETMTVFYDPEINPLKNRNIQRDNSITQPPLQCGIEYTVDIKIVASNKTETLLNTVQFLVPCAEVDGHFWRENTEANSWICSGQGKDDLRVSFSGSQSLFADIDSNQFGHFLIAWQSRRDNKTAIYGAIWDSEKDKLFSSGQGLYDKLYLPEGFKPRVITDQAQNFYISSYNPDNISSYKCSLPLSCVEDPPGEQVFENICYPGLDTFLNIDPREILIRVYSEDQLSSIVIDNNKSIPVVDKQDIRIDVSGIQGSYAVRTRNSEDDIWGDFINIDGTLFDNPNNIAFPTPEDDKLDAYFVGNDRFIVPIALSNVNGIRRICLQVLTFYGISSTVCLDLLVNLNVLSYRVDYYFDSGLTELAKEFDGFPILTEEKDINNIPVSSVTPSATTTVYIKVIFSKKQDFVDGDLVFNVFQQGLDDQHNLPLNVLNADEGTYTGFFEIRKHDGIFNRDGLGFVNVTFPGDPLNVNTGCVSDQSDKFNLLLNTKDQTTFVEAKPKEVLNKDKSGIINKVLDINELKQFYKKDDENFRFGNPGVFRTD